VRTALRTTGAAGAEAVAAAEAPEAAAAAAAAAEPAADAGAAAVNSSSEAAAEPVTDDEDIAVLRVGQIAAAADLGVATAAAGASATAATVVLRASAAAIQRVRASPRVTAVIQDRYVRAQARGLTQTASNCVTSSVMRSGVSIQAAVVKPALVNAFTALGCNVNNAKYVFKGSLCKGSSRNINYTEVAAVDRSSNAALRTSRGALCRLVRGPNAPVNAQRFGNCGTAPALVASLPVRVCSATGGNNVLGGIGTTPAGTVLPRVPLQPLEQVCGWHTVTYCDSVC
jgi:hypothetical protein